MSDKHQDGIRRGTKWAVEWLHNRAKEMNDPHATQILNAAAFNMGNDSRFGIKPGVVEDAELTKVIAQRDALLEVVRPFADAAVVYDTEFIHGGRISRLANSDKVSDLDAEFTVGDLRKARDVRNEIDAGKGT